MDSVIIDLHRELPFEGKDESQEANPEVENDLYLKRFFQSLSPLIHRRGVELICSFFHSLFFFLLNYLYITLFLVHSFVWFQVFFKYRLDTKIFVNDVEQRTKKPKPPL